MSDDPEARARRLSEMAAGVAHGLNNLLGAVAGQAAELLGDPGAVEPESEATRGLRLIHQAALDGAGLARRLLRLSRGEAADEPDAFVLVDLADVVADAVALTRPRWQDESARRGVTIDVRSDVAGPLPALGVAADLRETVVNLIMNAVDAIPAGGGVLLRGEAREGRAVLIVQDSGPGWPRRSRRGSSSRSSRPRAAAERAWGWRSCTTWSPGTAARCGSERGRGSGTTLHGGAAARGRGASGGGGGRAGEWPAGGRGRRRCRARDGLSILLVDDDPVFRAIFDHGGWRSTHGGWRWRLMLGRRWRLWSRLAGTCSASTTSCQI